MEEWFAMFFSVLAYTVLGLFLKGYVAFSFGEGTLSKLQPLTERGKIV